MQSRTDLVIHLSHVRYFLPELDFERFSKRRKLYKESSVSPVQVGEEEQELDNSLKSEEIVSPQPKLLPSSSLYDPDQLNREEDHEYKCRFLYSLGLQRVTSERRRGTRCFLLSVHFQKYRILSAPSFSPL